MSDVIQNKNKHITYLRRPLDVNFPIDLIMGDDVLEKKSKEVVTNQTVKPPFNERVIKKNDW